MDSEDELEDNNPEEEQQRGSSEEDEEDEEGLDEYEKDDFLVEGDVEEEVENEGRVEPQEETRPSRKVRSKKRRFRKLDKEDIELVHENLGIETGVPSYERPGKFRRLKKRSNHVPSPTELDRYRERSLPSPTGSDIGSEQEEEEDNYYNRRMTHRSTAEQEEVDDIFSVDREFLDSYDDDFDQQGQEVDLHQYYEPIELVDNSLTKEDETIRNIDLPERLQSRLIKKPSEDELQQEAVWIFKRMPRFQERVAETIIRKIEKLLKAMRVDAFEVPYIATYLKDLYCPEFTSDQLWELFDLDEKWIHFNQRKLNLMKLFQSIRSSTFDYLNVLDHSNTEEELSDLQNHFKLHHPKYFNVQDKAQPKKPQASNFYTICKQANILKLTPVFGISAQGFGENLLTKYISEVSTDYHQSPEDAAVRFISETFPTVDSVLKACNYVLAQDIAHDFQVKKILRKEYYLNAVVTTEPTKQGELEIDVRHPYRSVKRLKNQPIQSFSTNTQFGLILKAIEDKLLTVKIHLPNDYLEYTILPEMIKCYTTIGTSEISKKWNEERKKILRAALFNFIDPAFSKELIDKLTNDVKERIVNRGYKKLKEITMYGPYKMKTRTVMSVLLGPEPNDPVICVTVNREGELISLLKLEFMMITDQQLQNKEGALKPSIFQERKTTDLAKLSEFITTTKPAVIVVGASCMAAAKLMEELKELTKEVSKQYYAVASTIWGSIQIPKICAVSNAYEKEFQSQKYSQLVRTSISLARYLQDPLSQLSILFNENQDITCLPLDPLQSIVGKYKLIKGLERAMIDSINAVGVDINKLMDHTHLSSQLQFISGLGRRKAEGLTTKARKQIRRKIISREELISLQGETVSNNCIGFIRIGQYSIEQYDENTTILDDTRIHPDHYEYGRKIMRQILDLSEDGYDSENDLEDAYTNIKSHENLFSRLTLNGKDFQKVPPLLLKDIKKELIRPFEDPRIPYEEPSLDTLFSLLTGETEQTLSVGLVITVTVSKITPVELHVKLDSGLTGTIEKGQFDDLESVKFSDRVTVGQALTCKVLSIDKDKFTVTLTSKKSQVDDLIDDHMDHPNRDDPYFNKLQKSGNKSKRNRPEATKRAISHPYFKNITYLEAENELEDAASGELLFRPSSKGTGHITLTFKFHDEFAHIDIIEEGKASDNPLGLGKQLKIGDKVYEDLNHIIAHYVEPITVYMEEMKSFRKFSPDSEQDIELKLRSLKKQDPKSIPYLIGISRAHPGRYVLYYIPNTSLKKEYISCTSDGFRFRGTIYKNIEKLLAWFKLHWREIAQQPKSNHTHSNSFNNSNANSRKQNDSSSNRNNNNNTNPGYSFNKNDYQSKTAGWGDDHDDWGSSSNQFNNNQPQNRNPQASNKPFGYPPMGGGASQPKPNSYDRQSSSGWGNNDSGWDNNNSNSQFSSGRNTSARGPPLPQSSYQQQPPQQPKKQFASAQSNWGANDWDDQIQSNPKPIWPGGGNDRFSQQSNYQQKEWGSAGPSVSGDDQFTIYAKTSATQSRPINVKYSDSIQFIKQKISSAEGISIDRLNLSSDGKPLSDDHRTLGEYNVRPNSTIQVESTSSYSAWN